MTKIGHSGGASPGVIRPRQVDARQVDARQIDARQVDAGRQVGFPTPPRSDAPVKIEPRRVLGVPGQEASASGDAVATIGQRLGLARRQLGITQIDLANRMGTTQPSLARFEKDATVPNVRTVTRYAEAIGYRASARLESGVGGSDSPRSIACALDQLPEVMSDIRKSLGVTQNQVAHRMGTTQPIVARFERGDPLPNIKTLEKYADAIGVRLGIDLVKSSG